ncbi:MAG: hypothetical protein MAG795_00476 [Candidatus Woesearchaeota archaeon]|nr:hypothetical protein [Candidatus Woesearchaeota archaeon]
MYVLKFDEKAIEFLEKSDNHIKKRIFNKIRNSKKNPFHFWERLASRKDFKLRIGVYRAIADIDKDSKTILITVIGHRKNIYKN